MEMNYELKDLLSALMTSAPAEETSLLSDQEMMEIGKSTRLNSSHRLTSRMPSSA